MILILISGLTKMSATNKPTGQVLIYIQADKLPDRRISDFSKELILLIQKYKVSNYKFSGIDFKKESELIWV